MADSLLDGKNLAAFYFKASEVLTLRGSCESSPLTGNPRFVLRILPTGGIVVDVRGNTSNTSAVPLSAPMADFDIAVTIPSKAFPNNQVVFNTKKNSNVVVPIQMVEGKAQVPDIDPDTLKPPGPGGIPKGNPSSGGTTAVPVTQPTNPASGDIKLGGSKGLPPPELNFVPWLDTASKAAKLKYPGTEPVLVMADATKQPITGGAGKYTLTFSATFLVLGNKMMTMVDTNGVASKTEPIPSLMPTPVKNLKPTRDLWDIFTTNSALVGSYTGVSYQAGLNDIPSYCFNTSDVRLLGAFSTIDGKRLDVKRDD